MSTGQGRGGGKDKTHLPAYNNRRSDTVGDRNEFLPGEEPHDPPFRPPRRDLVQPVLRDAVRALAQMQSVDQAVQLSQATGRPIFALAGNKT